MVYDRCLTKNHTTNLITFAFQPTLRPALLPVFGSADYREQRRQFERIDLILTESKLDAEFLALALKDQGIDPATLCPKKGARFAMMSALSLRANLARTLLQLPHRPFCARVADSPLLQWFLQLGEIRFVKIFAKSTSERFSQWVSPESMLLINQKSVILSTTLTTGEAPAPRFGLGTAPACDEVFFDTTCVKSNIHFPVDWLLLRDASRTLMKATLCIRSAGLKERMPQSPEAFLRDMNILCMAMSAQGRKLDSRKQRKRLLRDMKQLEKRIAGHACSHREALVTRRSETVLSEGRAGLIIARIDHVLTLLPEAIRQAHERIIGGRQVRSQDKILSLYDRDINVIVRGKAGAAVEFGNKLSLSENRQGLILDYKLHRDNPSDPSLVAPTLVRLVDDMKLPVGKLWSDRGMHSKKNEVLLYNRGIASGLCPRQPAALQAALQEPGVAEGMKRRGGTEARIGIFKNQFLNNPMTGKSFAARDRACGWAVLTHNLWVLARQPLAKRQKVPPAKANQAAAARLRAA